MGYRRLVLPGLDAVHLRSEALQALRADLVEGLDDEAPVRKMRRWRAVNEFDSCAATRVRGFISLNVRRAARIIVA